MYPLSLFWKEGANMLGIDCASADDAGTADWSKAIEGGPLRFAIVRGAYGDVPDATFDRSWRALENRGGREARTCSYGSRSADMPSRLTPTSRPSVSQARSVHSIGRTFHRRSTSSSRPRRDGKERSNCRPGARVGRGRVAGPVRRIRHCTDDYTSARVWSEDLNDVPAPDFLESPLWLAKPWPWAVRSKAQLDTAVFADGKLNPAVPSPWGNQWFIHQYQGDALGFPGFASTVDINRFRPILPGSVGDHVKWIQRHLGACESGVFDAATQGAVVAFQRANALTADGIAGPRTFALLCRNAQSVQPS